MIRKNPPNRLYVIFLHFPSTEGTSHLCNLRERKCFQRSYKTQITMAWELLLRQVLSCASEISIARCISRRATGLITDRETRKPTYFFHAFTQWENLFPTNTASSPMAGDQRSAKNNRKDHNTTTATKRYSWRSYWFSTPFLRFQAADYTISVLVFESSGVSGTPSLVLENGKIKIKRKRQQIDTIGLIWVKSLGAVPIKSHLSKWSQNWCPSSMNTGFKHSQILLIINPHLVVSNLVEKRYQCKKPKTEHQQSQCLMLGYSLEDNLDYRQFSLSIPSEKHHHAAHLNSGHYATLKKAEDWLEY